MGLCRPVLRRFWLFLLIFVIVPSASARLGENEKTVELDRAAMRGVHSIVSHEHFRVHEITSTGQTVREYATNDGTVFAVTWRGVGAPDLSQIFGAYYQEYRDADAATPKPRGRAPKLIRSSNLVVHRFGHMGDVRGKAYIPALLPNGVSLKDIH